MTIQLTLPPGESLVTGKQVSFESPCKSEGLTGITVDGITYDIVDALGNTLSPNSFESGAIVSVIFSVETRKAFVQNAGISKYIEENFIKKGTLSPLNLLDNSDFTNLVNQRGKTSYGGSSNAPIFDRWRTRSADLTYSIGNDGVTITNSSNSYAPLHQSFEKGVINLNDKYTLVVWYNDGNTSVHTFIPSRVPNGSAFSDRVGVIFKSYDDYDSLGIMIANNSTICISKVALYKGEFIPENLPEYSPKGVNDLLECRRYLQLIGSAQYESVVGFGIVENASAKTVKIFVPSSLPMRNTLVGAAITGGSAGVLDCSDSTSALNKVISIDLARWVGNGFCLVATLEKAPSSSMQVLKLQAGSYLYLNCER